MRFMRTAAGTHDEVVERRGEHVVLFEDGDHADLLKTAQPHLSWAVVTAAGGTTFPCLPYAEVAAIMGRVLWVEGLGFPGKNFLTHCVGELGLDRSWKALLLGITDWSACRPGDFGARIRVASANSLVDRSQLKLLEADFYLIPPLDFSSAELTDLAWARHLTFTPGALVSTSDGSLEVWADLEYYSEMRIPLAGRGAESAMVATLRQGYEGAVAAMVTAGATTTLVSQLRPASKAGLVAAHVAKLPLPAPLQTFSPAGLAREAEAFTRVAYLASAGLGAAAERVVIPLLESALDWGEWAIVKTAVHGCLPGHPKVELLPAALAGGSLARLA